MIASRASLALLSWRGERLAGLVVFLVIVTLCLFVPVFSHYPPNEFVDAPLLPPGSDHYFGTDAVGRDVFVRTFVGGRVDLLVAAVATLFALFLGTLVGTVSGASRVAWLDALFMRVVHAVTSFPLIILILFLVVIIGSDHSWGPFPPGVASALAALLAVQWTTYAQLARGQALVLARSDFALAAQVTGLSRARVLLFHIAPGVLRLGASHAVGEAVVVVVILSSMPFLGAGVQPPAAEWGAMMYEGRAFLGQAWWITMMPGLVLAITGFSLSAMADPRTRDESV